MKVAIVAPSSVPFVLGGAERAWTGIADEINRNTPHDAEIIKLPSREHSFAQLVSNYRSFAELDVSHFDVVVTSKYPAWMVRHPNHIVYTMHPLRGLYDMYPQDWATDPTPTDRATRRLLDSLRSLEPGRPGGQERILELAGAAVAALPLDHPDLAFPGPLVRQLVRWLDADAMHPNRIARYMSISQTVASRPGYFPVGATVEAVTLPSSLTGFRCDSYDDFFTVSRLDHAKRIDLLIRAMREVRAPVRLRIAGDGPAAEELRALAAGDPRIIFLGRLNDDQLLDEYARALAVPFVPFDEDLGLITIEAQMSGKAVLTCGDSGGCTEHVIDGVSGFVTHPTPTSIAAGLELLAADRERTAAMGAVGRASAAQVTWSHVVERLLDHDGASRHRASGTPPAARPRILVLSTYCAFPSRHGGQVRLANLCSGLAERYDVDLLAFPNENVRPGHGQVAPHITQWAVDISHEQSEIDAQLSRATGVATGDITTSLAIDRNRPFVETAQRLAEGAVAVMLEQPYLAPLLDHLPEGLPVIFDAQNAEFALKSAMYDRSPAGAAIASAVADVERLAMARADLLIACSSSDLDALLGLGPTLADIHVVLNGTASDAFPFTTGSERVRNRDAVLSRVAERLGGSFDNMALFLGSAHAPNIEAAIHLIGLASGLPRCLFVFAGGHADQIKPFGLPKNVLLRGAVTDGELEQLLTSCDVAVNPMITGSGSNIKLLDYFSAGAPSVATAVGARGLPIEHESHLIICDPEEVISSIHAVLAAPEESEARARRARIVAEELDWTRLAHRFRVLVDALLDDAPRRDVSTSRSPVSAQLVR